MNQKTKKEKHLFLSINLMKICLSIVLLIDNLNSLLESLNELKEPPDFDSFVCF